MINRLWLISVFLLAGCYSSAHVQRDNEAQYELPAASIEDLLESLIRKYNPGVRVYRVNGGLQIRIRGSLQEPHYMIDGVLLAGGPSGVLVGLNPNDVENVEVITELAKLSYYGLRGGSGIVAITTKR